MRWSDYLPTTRPGKPRVGSRIYWDTLSKAFRHITSAGVDAALGVTTPAAHSLDSHTPAAASIEFAQQQALQFVIENRTSDPGAPVAGQVWLRVDL